VIDAKGVCRLHPELARMVAGHGCPQVSGGDLNAAMLALVNPLRE